MPQPFNASDELSLRHLPDVSDSSFSFQIPGAIRGDNLLADDDLDFFKGPDVSIVPFASPSTTTEPLFALTPKPPSSEDGKKLDSFSTLSYHSKDHDTNLKQRKTKPHQLSRVTTNVNILSETKSKLITKSSTAVQLPSCEGSPAAVRLDNLRAELNLLSDSLLTTGSSSNVDHQVLPAVIHHRPKGILRRSLEKKVMQQVSPRNSQKVIGGGISKTRYSKKLSSIASGHPDGTDALLIQQEQNIAISDTKQANEDLSFADSSMSSAARGVAGRLVMYSQKLISSSELFGADKDKSLKPSDVFLSQDHEGADDIVRDEAPDRPLTLSQLSPQKALLSRDLTPILRNNEPMSPLRLPSKRPLSAASNVLQKRKKSKTDEASVDVLVPKPTEVPKARPLATKRHAKPISSSNSELRVNRSIKSLGKTRVNKSGIKRPPAFKPEGKDMRIATVSASSSGSATSGSTSKLKSSNGKDAEPVNSITLTNKGKSVASSSQGSSRASDRAPPPATKPDPFKFQTDKRCLDVQKDGDQGRNNDAHDDRVKRLRSSRTIPDFKATHVAQEAELALRKENIQPVVPLPIRWETDYRVKERQKFDERVREKGREHERLMELRRKEREEEEEREVRELRKKAVPKAHEIPEWYKEAPKKKKDNAIVGSIGR